MINLLEEKADYISELYATGYPGLARDEFSALRDGEKEKVVEYLETASTYEIWDNGDRGQSEFNTFINFLRS